MKAKIEIKYVIMLLLAAIIIQSCLVKVAPGDKRFSFAKHLITYEEQQILENEFINNKYDGKESRVYSYNLEDLEGYINYVKTKTKEKGYKNVKINVYLASYPETGYTKMQDPSYAGYNTIFFAPSAEKNPGNADALPSEEQRVTDVYGMDFGSLKPPGGIGTSGTGVGR